MGYNRIAIINRGEAARRLIRAVRDINSERGTRIETVALTTPPDRDAPFALDADHVLDLPVPAGKSAAAAYLDHDAVLACIQRAGADAAWVGWGFVAEDAAFNAKLRAAGIRYIGPSPEAMRLVGDKVEAKRLAESVGVAVVPWSQKPIATSDEAEAIAATIGYPVALKAAAGGGGRGIRIVGAAGELSRAFNAASQEAAKAFGDGRLFVERCITRARHLEVQVAGDAYGHAVALGVRDCTIQRRHQKLIEEAPGPIATSELAADLAAHAVKITTAAHYENVGTVEFIFDRETRSAYFMEMNARLQVEHPVTELVAGIDLVKLQLDIADGRGVDGLVVSPRGCAIEVRLNAEDPDRDFAPSPGRVRRFAPAQGPGVRVDAGVKEGSCIPSDFDSMIAKVIGCGATREEALARVARALRETVVQIEGGATNKSLLLAVLNHPDFRSGDIDTRWLDREASALAARPDAALALVAAALVIARREEEATLAGFVRAVGRGVPQTVPVPGCRDVRLGLGGATYVVQVACVGCDRYRVALPEAGTVLVSFVEDSPGAGRLEIAASLPKTTPRRLALLYELGETEVALELDGIAHRVSRDSGGVVRAPSPCLVTDIAVKEGEIVAAGDRLLALEAMKMEMPVRATQSGRVARIAVHVNAQVPAGAPLIVIEPVPATQAEEAARAPAPVAKLSLPSHPSELDRLFGADGSVRWAELDAGTPETRERLAAAIGAELTATFLGYDLEPARLAALAALVGGSSWARLIHPHEYRDLGRALVAFADVSRLFSTGILEAAGDGRLESMQMAFYNFVHRLNRGAEGLAPAFRDAITRALAHYGVHGFTPSAALQKAALRMAMAHGRGDEAAVKRLQLASSLVGVMLGLHAAGADLSDTPGLAEALAQIAIAAPRKAPVLADNAYQAHYLLFEQARFERRPEQLELFVAQSLAAAAALPDGSAERAQALLTLARSSEPVVPLLLAVTNGKTVRLGEHTPSLVVPALEAFLLRIYAERSAIALAASGLMGVFVDRAATGTEGGLVAVCQADEVEACVSRLREAARRLEGQTAAVADVVVHGAGEERDAAARRRWAEWVRACAGDALGKELARITLVLVASDGRPTYVSLPEEENAITALHPATARRLELARLGEYELKLESARDDLVLLEGQARASRKDRRFFVLGEVRGCPEDRVCADATGLALFKHVYFEAVRALRAAQSRRNVKERLSGNRIVIRFGPVLVAGRDEVMRVGADLWQHTRGLGLDGLVVRARVVAPEREDAPATDAEIVVKNPTGHQLEVRFGPARQSPWPAATAYDLKVMRALALEVPYPYEVIRMLTSEPGVLTAAGTPFPPGRFVEYDLHPSGAPRAVPVLGRPYGQNSAGIVFGLISHQTAKHPEGMDRVIILSDPLRGMGSLAEPECARIIAALDLAASRGIPVEWVPISSGAHIAMDSGTENLDWTARVLRSIIEHTQAGLEINIIVDGINVGAQSYFNAEATMLMHTRGVLIMTPRGSMVLTGKRALDYSGGVSAEDERGIGGYERIMGPNGQAQHLARDLAHAFQILLEHYRFSYRKPGEAGVRPEPCADPSTRDVTQAPYGEGAIDAAFTRVGEIFGAANAERKKPFAMRALMDAVMDESGGYLERFPHMRQAEIAIVRDCHVGGEAVRLIGIESQTLPRAGFVPGDGPDAWNGGTLFPLSSKKVARAINAASGNRPLVVLANLSGFDGSPESMRRLQLEYGAEIGRAVVTFKGPILFCVVARYHGGAYVVFSKALNDGLTAVAVEGSYASVIGGAAAAAVVFATQVRDEADRDVRVLAKKKQRDAGSAEEQPRLREELARVYAEVLGEKQGELGRSFDRVHSVERACAVGSLDAVILPAQLRAELIRLLVKARRSESAERERLAVVG